MIYSAPTNDTLLVVKPGDIVKIYTEDTWFCLSVSPKQRKFEYLQFTVHWLSNKRSLLISNYLL